MLIFRFAKVKIQLKKLTEVKLTFQWIPEFEAAFETIKETLCRVPIIA
jgi:hypothetical protein